LIKKAYFLLFFLLSSAVIISSYLSGCNNETPVTPPQGQTISFTKDVFPIFQSNCALSGCHANRVQNSDNLDLSSWQSMMYGGYTFGAVIVPYNAFWSGLVSHINSDTNLSIVATPRMPIWRPGVTTGAHLTPGAIHTIVQWINEGAKDDYGNVAFANIPRKAFITNQASDFVAVVNTDNNFLVRLIPVGGRHGSNTLAVPHHVTVDNQGTSFYVALINEGYIEKYDAHTYQQTGRLNLSSSPAEVFLNRDGTTGFVTNWDATGLDRSIKIVDTRNFNLITEVSDIRLKATHGGRVTHNDSSFIAVSQLSEYIIFISTSNYEITDAVPVANDVPPNGNGTQKYQPYAVDVSKDDRYAFITCPPANNVRVLDLNTHQIIKIIPVGNRPVMVAVSPDNSMCYVTNRNDGTVSVIDLNSLEVVFTIQNVGQSPHGIDFTSDGHFAYITCESRGANNPFIHHPVTQSVKPGTTAVIDVWAGHVKIDNIEMASFPNGIAITPK
jgi:YVTN family beta-propeller protein